MKFFAPLLLLLLVGNAAGPPEAAIQYFRNVRQVHISQPDRQNYFLVDEEIWRYSRPDLGDLRLYDGDSPVQYALVEQRAGITSQEVEAKILNLGRISGHTEFDLDAEGLAEYDRIRLRLDAHDFVATASVSGGGAPGKASEVELTPSTLYDFTKEQLGSNSLLKLPTSSFRYLHVRLSPGIQPQQVKGAAIYNLREQKASWTKMGSCAAPQTKQRLTLIRCTAPVKVPLSRILLQVAPEQVNFRRTVTVETGAVGTTTVGTTTVETTTAETTTAEDRPGQPIAGGEISRVRLNRAGILVTSEELAVSVNGSPGEFTLAIDNGDNPPLKITAAEPFSVERRIYFDPQGKTTLRLFYGDEKLSSPVYDYARFFHLDASPAEAQLSAGGQNAQYSGRPDERPWSERHQGILWAAMTLAVLVLAILALRGLRAGNQQ